MTGILIHYGYHPGTTGSYLASAAVNEGVGYPRPHNAFDHVSSSLIRDCSSYLWVESGANSYPIDAWNISVPTAGYLIDVHQHPRLSLLQAALFDVVFVAQRSFIDKALAVNPNTHWLPLAAPGSFVKSSRRDIQYEVGFVGSLQESASRARLLRDLRNTLVMNAVEVSYSPDEMRDIYLQSQCVVNPPVKDDINMRFFEAMACGAALITPALPDLAELGSPGEDFLVLQNFSVPQEVAAAVRQVIDSGRALEIGDAGRNLVRKRHTYEHRIREVSSVLMANGGLSAPIRMMPQRDRIRHMLAIGEQARDYRLVASSAGKLRFGTEIFRPTARVASTMLRRRGRGVVREIGRFCRHLLRIDTG